LYNFVAKLFKLYYTLNVPVDLTTLPVGYYIEKIADADHCTPSQPCTAKCEQISTHFCRNVAWYLTKCSTRSLKWIEMSFGIMTHTDGVRIRYGMSELSDQRWCCSCIWPAVSPHDQQDRLHCFSAVGHPSTCWAVVRISEAKVAC